MLRSLLFAVLTVLLLCLSAGAALAAPTDVIHDFTITVDVNDDASLNMAYHIEWEVLDDSVGKLDWISLGVPNNSHENITPKSETIKRIKDEGSKLAIYLDRSYGEGETVTVDFSMKQDRMYQIDKWNEGETAYTFTPAWFDGMYVENLTIRWNEKGAVRWQPDCLIDQGYLTFSTSLSPGGKYTMSVVYPNDAFGFVPERQAGTGSAVVQKSDEEETNIFVQILGIVVGLFGIVVGLVTPVWLIFRFFRWIGEGLGFGTGQKTVKKKITRTKIEYYENCPNCGAPREEGKEKCPYCKRSMIKNKEIVEESQLEEPEKYRKSGTYRYGSSPNTYIHVNVVNVPVSRPRRSRSIFSGGSSGSSSGRSSGSSCACACASSCACACACASSGRAGCSVKDFFKKSIHEGRVRITR